MLIHMGKMGPWLSFVVVVVNFISNSQIQL